MAAAPALGFVGSPCILGLRRRQGSFNRVESNFAIRGRGTRLGGLAFGDGRRNGRHAPAALFAMRSSDGEDDPPPSSVLSSLNAELSEISEDEEDLYGEAEAYRSQDGTTVQNMAGNPGQQLLTRMDGERVVKLTTSGFRPILLLSLFNLFIDLR